MIIRGNNNSNVKYCYSLNENVIHSYKLLEGILVIESQSNFLMNSFLNNFWCKKFYYFIIA
jgi:hypothetical protein